MHTLLVIVHNTYQFLVPSDIQTLKRTIRYIKDTLTLGIEYQKIPQGYILHGCFDADWEGDKDTLRSTS